LFPILHVMSLHQWCQSKKLTWLSPLKHQIGTGRLLIFQARNAICRGPNKAHKPYQMSQDFSCYRQY
jgi:hypothetical protein